MILDLGLLLAGLHAAGALAALDAASRSHTAQGAVAWAVSLALLPEAALPLYLAVGPPDFAKLAVGRAEARRAALARAADARAAALRPAPEDAPLIAPLASLAPLPALRAPRPRLLIDAAVFEAMFDAIAGAERLLVLQFYIIRDDGLGRRFRDALAEKARAGVRVLLLYDEVGSRGAPTAYWDSLRAAGVEVLPFAIRRRRPKITRINFRNHRKAVTADGRIAVVGGPNIGDEYLGRDPAFGAWRDTGVLLEGAAAAAVEASALEDWLWAGGAAAPPAGETTAAAPEHATPVLTLPTGPADAQPACTLALLHLIASAERRLWIASPYFAPDLDVMSALKLAALRGVDVRVLIPDRPDHYVVWLAAFEYAEEAQRAGVALHRYAEGFMHQKALLLDDRAAAVGTVNLDARSIRLNFELTALVFDQGFAREVAAMLEADFARSRLYDAAAHARRGLLPRLLGPPARLLGPLL